MNELAARYLDGIATEAEAAELSALLRFSEAARVEYLRLAQVHAALALDTALWVPQPVTTRPVRWKMAAALVAAACVAIAFILRDQTTPEPVATLVLAENCAWSRGAGWQEGQRLPPETLRLQQGTAMIRFDGGASLIMQGEVTLQLENSGSARLLLGEVIVRAPEEAAGFVIHAADRTITDLGTEFAVKVTADAQTELHVLEGEVSWHGENSHTTPQIIQAGKALRFAAQRDTTPLEMAVMTKRFDTTIQLPTEPKALRVREGFEYGEGTHDPAVLQGGTGWAGPWRLRTLADGGTAYSGTSRDMLMRDGGWLTPAGKTFRARSLAEPLDMARDGIVYLSILIHEPAHVSAGKFNEGVNLSFRSSAQFLGECVSLRLSSGLRPLIETGVGQGFVSRVIMQDNQTLLMVAKIVSRRDGEDEISLRVYGGKEQPEFIEPATWDVTTRGLKQSARLDLLTLQSSGNAPRKLDEIRIGPTWRSVTAAK